MATEQRETTHTQTRSYRYIKRCRYWDTDAARQILRYSSQAHTHLQLVDATVSVFVNVSVSLAVALAASVSVSVLVALSTFTWISHFTPSYICCFCCCCSLFTVFQLICIILLLLRINFDGFHCTHSSKEIFVKTFDEILHSLVFFYRNLFAQSATTFLRKEINILVFFIGFL